MGVVTRLRIAIGLAVLCLYVAGIIVTWFLLEMPYCAIRAFGHGAAFRNRFTWHTSWHGHTLFRLFLWIFKIKGRFHLPRANLAEVPGSMIVIANHGSLIDIPLLCSVMQRIGRTRLRWIMKKSLKRWPPFGWAGQFTRCGFVQRGGHAGDQHAVRRCAQSAREDIADVVYFPEGTRFTGATGAELKHLRLPRRGGFQALCTELPDAPVFSVTIRWSGGDAQRPFGHGLASAADFLGQTLDVYAELIPRSAVNAHPDWLNAHWHAKDALLDQRP